MATPHVNSLGGSMYGDGEYIVIFHNAHSTQAPLTATVVDCVAGTSQQVGFQGFDAKASRALATRIIRMVRTNDPKALV